MKDLILELDLHSKVAWQRLIDSRPWKGEDIYFLPAWYETWQASGYGQAKCLYVLIDGYEFLYPFLYRPIEGYELRKTYYDVETAYGYGGILFNENPPHTVVNQLNRVIDGWMRDNNVVAEFIRLAPTLNDHMLREAFYIPVRKDVFLDLAETSQQIVWETVISGSTRNRIRKSEKYGLQLKVSEPLDDETFSDFVTIYREAAHRIGMDSFYHFPDKYFEALKEILGPYALAVNVEKDGDPAAASVWLRYKNKLHYYLAGTGNKFVKVQCSHAYMWRLVSYELELNRASIVHFGGGMTTNPDDTLFQFKAKYGNRFSTTYIGRKTHFKRVYSSICNQWQKRYPNLVAQHGHKLLKYRLIAQ